MSSRQIAVEPHCLLAFGDALSQPATDDQVSQFVVRSAGDNDQRATTCLAAFGG
jgi:hypothetical protein